MFRLETFVCNSCQNHVAWTSRHENESSEIPAGTSRLNFAPRTQVAWNSRHENESPEVPITKTSRQIFPPRKQVTCISHHKNMSPEIQATEPFKNIRLLVSVWAPSFGDFRFGTFALELAFNGFRLQIVAWELTRWSFSFGNFRLGTSNWDPWLWIFWLGSFVWEHSLQNVRLRTFVLDPSPGIFLFEIWLRSLSLITLGWNLQLNNFTLNTLA